MKVIIKVPILQHSAGLLLSAGHLITWFAKKAHFDCQYENLAPPDRTILILASGNRVVLYTLRILQGQVVVVPNQT